MWGEKADGEATNAVSKVAGDAPRYRLPIKEGSLSVDPLSSVVHNGHKPAVVVSSTQKRSKAISVLTAMELFPKLNEVL